MAQEEIVISKKYALIHQADEYVVVDTGSPVSYHRSGQLSFAGACHSCPTQVADVDSRALAEECGLPIGGVLGMDILNSYAYVVFDYGNAQITVGDEPRTIAAATPLPSGHIMDVPYIDMLVNGKAARVFVDTGAPIAYISSSYTQGLPLCDRLHDYNPTLGEFWTDIYHVKVKIRAEEHLLPFGNLPSIAQMALKMVGVHGIIGYELFCRYPMLYQNHQWFVCSPTTHH